MANESLMARLPGGHSRSVGWRPEKLGYQQSAVYSWLFGVNPSVNDNGNDWSEKDSFRQSLSNSRFIALLTKT